MNKRILIAPNSFKNCADSVTLAELIKQNLSTLTDVGIISKPVSDGGDGFLNVCKHYYGGEIINYFISTPYDNSKFECPILYCEQRKEVYIESADVLGLKVVPKTYRNPLKLTSKGLGNLLIKIENNVQKGKINVENVFIGIGGTATIDMGMGMMSELGLILLDSNGELLNVIPENFHRAERIDYSEMKFSFELIPIVDVSNSLFGMDGGIHTFGKQKGANEKSILVLENNFNHLCNLFINNGLSFSSQVLSGAGGGIPASLQIFYGTSIINSSKFIMYNLEIEQYSDIMNYVITGEGAFDNQSRLGKGAGVIIDLFTPKVELIFLLAGSITDQSRKQLPKSVFPIELSKYFISEFESIKNYKVGLEMACKEIIKQLNF